MTNSHWQNWKKAMGETRPWDILDPNAKYADKKISEYRLKVCLDCPQLIPFTKQCKKCGCFMSVKTKLENASCPLGKW